MLTKGMIGFSNNKTSLLGRLIRFFTNSNITHTFIITFPGANGEVRFEEASTVVAEGDFQSNYGTDTNTAYWVFKIKDGIVDDATIDASLKYCHDTFLGDQYGKLQLLYFPYRWFMQTFFNKDVRREKNWFTAGVICAELVYWFLYKLGPTFQQLLSDFTPDTIQAQDIMSLVEMNPNLFEFVDKKL